MLEQMKVHVPPWTFVLYFRTSVYVREAKQPSVVTSSLDAFTIETLRGQVSFKEFEWNTQHQMELPKHSMGITQPLGDNLHRIVGDNFARTQSWHWERTEPWTKANNAPFVNVSSVRQRLISRRTLDVKLIHWGRNKRVTRDSMCYFFRDVIADPILFF